MNNDAVNTDDILLDGVNEIRSATTTNGQHNVSSTTTNGKPSSTTTNEKSSSTEKKTDIVIIPQPIKIMVKLNTDFNSPYQEFTYDMLDHPTMKDANNVDSKYPYFTSSCKIPYNILFGTDYVHVLEFFFSRNKFERVLMKHPRNYVDETIIYQLGEIPSDEETKEKIRKIDENGRYNVECMLKLLFPIEPSLNQTFSSSFHHYVLKNTNTNILDDLKYFNLYPNTGQLKVNGQTHIVADVVWVNDIVNHPVYLDFLKKYNSAIIMRQGNIGRIRTEYINKLYKFYIELNRLYNPRPAQPAAPPPSQSLPQSPPQSPPATPPPPPATPTFFDKLYEKIQNEDPSKMGYSASLNMKKQSIDTILTQLEPFRIDLKSGAIATISKYHKYLNQMLDTKENNEISRSLVAKKNEDTTLEDILSRIIRIYIEMRQNSKTDAPINIGSEYNAKLTVLYDNAIALRAINIIDKFMTNEIPSLDMKLKNKDDTDKPKEERDVIQYISNNYSNFAKMSEDIISSRNNVSFPIRETTNLNLKLKLNELTAKRILETDNPSVKDAAEFFQNVYNFYVLRKGMLPPDTSLMYTGVNVVQSAYSSEAKGGLSGSYFEIYVLIDTIEKSKFDTGKNRCLLKDDALSNMFNHVLYSKMSSLVNPYRDFTNFEKGIFSDGPTAPATAIKGGNNTVLKLSKKFRRTSYRKKGAKRNYTSKRGGNIVGILLSPTHKTLKKKRVHFNV